MGIGMQKQSMVVESVKGRGLGRPRKTWRQCVDEDMAKLNLSLMGTYDRAKWRNGIMGNRLTRAVAREKQEGRQLAYTATDAPYTFLP